MDNSTASCNHCKSSLNTETDFINYYRWHTHVHYNCLKDIISLIFKWNNRNNPPNYTIKLMRSPSFLYIYICPK